MTQAPSFGVSQKQRLAAELGSRLPRLDLRTDADWLAMGARFAALFKFYDRDGKHTGSFEPFFTVDAQILSASIACLPWQSSKQLLVAAAQQHDSVDVAHVLGCLLDLWKQVDRWVAAFPQGTPFEALRQHLLAETHGRLAEAVSIALRDLGLHELREIREFASSRQPHHWASTWELARRRPSATAPADPLRAMRSAVVLTRDSLESIIAQAQAAVAATDWLHARSTPQVALFIAFVRRFSALRERVDQLPARHLDFYVRRVLKQVEADGVAEQSWVVLEPKPQPQRVTIDAGHIVTSSERPELRFQTMSTLALSRASIVAAAIVTIQSGEKDSRRFSFRHHTLEPASTPRCPGSGWSTFSAPSDPADVAEHVEGPELGLAFPARCLNQVDGHRALTLSLRVRSDVAIGDVQDGLFRIVVCAQTQWVSCQNVRVTCIARGTAELTLEIRCELPADAPPATPPGTGCEVDGLSADVPIIKVLLASCAPGVPAWLLSLRVLAIDLQVITSGCRPGTLSTSVGPFPGRGPGAPFGAMPEVGAYLEIADSPVLALTPARVTVSVSWQGLPTRVAGFLYGFRSYFEGYLEPPVVPGTPTEDSRSTSHARPVEKQLGSLPTPPAAFDDTAFRISAWALVDGQWMQSAFVDILSGAEFAQSTLFGQPRTQLADGPRTFHVRLPNRPASAGPRRLRLVLDSPPQGFGRSLYASSTQAAALANAKQPSRKNERAVAAASSQRTSEVADEPSTALDRIKAPGNSVARWLSLFRLGWLLAVFRLLSVFKKSSHAAPRGVEGPTPPPPAPLYPLPRPPYTPMATDISLGFEISESIYSSGSTPPSWQELGRAALVNLIPVHLRAARDLPRDEGVWFLPSLDAGSAVALEIADVTAGEVLNVLWIIAPGEPYREEEVHAPLQWTWLTTSGEWKPASDISRSAGVSFTQMPDLTQTCLIQIAVPDDVAFLASSHGVRKARLRIFDPTSKNRNRTVAIHVNAVVVRRYVETNERWTHYPVPARSLNALSPSVKAVREVWQPLAGFGGRPPEQTSQMVARTAERLRHKGRAWTPWDYERLALAASDGIFAARCFPAQRIGDQGRLQSAPGFVTLVLVPRVRTTGGDLHGFPPRLALEDLHLVRNALESVMPRMARLELRCARFALVRVECMVRAPASLSPIVVRQRLEHDLRILLSAWVYAPEQAEFVSSRIPDDRMLRRYIEQRDYVASVLGPCRIEYSPDSDAAEWTVPVSSPEHRITASPWTT